MTHDVATEVLFIGGRSGAGKTTAALEVSRVLTRADVAHAVIEGDNLDQAHPEPWRNGIDLAERNLAAMWRNYRDLGYSRLIYTNTVSVLEMPGLIAALGGEVRATGVLLVANDHSVAQRLAVRETGSSLDVHLARSARAATGLATTTPPSVRRVATDGRAVVDIAQELVDITGWLDRA